MCFEIMKAEVSVYALRGWGRGLTPEGAAPPAQAPAPVIQRPGGECWGWGGDVAASGGEPWKGLWVGGSVG